jgi:hypothetical protein
VWHNNSGVSTTQLGNTSNLLPSVAPTGATTGMLVTSTAADNGLVQTFATLPSASFDAWVYVLQGQVSIGIGNGGSTTGTAFSSSTGTWQHLSANSNSASNEVIVYSSGPAVYYVTSAVAVPEPAGFAILAIGVAALVMRKRRN